MSTDYLVEACVGTRVSVDTFFDSITEHQRTCIRDGCAENYASSKAKFCHACGTSRPRPRQWLTLKDRFGVTLARAGSLPRCMSELDWKRHGLQMYSNEARWGEHVRVIGVPLIECVNVRPWLPNNKGKEQWRQRIRPLEQGLQLCHIDTAVQDVEAALTAIGVPELTRTIRLFMNPIVSS